MIIKSSCAVMGERKRGSERSGNKNEGVCIFIPLIFCCCCCCSRMRVQSFGLVSITRVTIRVVEPHVHSTRSLHLYIHYTYSLLTFIKSQFVIFFPLRACVRCVFSSTNQHKHSNNRWRTCVDF